MVLCRFRGGFVSRHGAALGTLLGFLAFYWWFDRCGGWNAAPDGFWIFLPTVEGAAYAVLIAWYDSSFSPTKTGLSGWLGWMGERSYSVYLLHFFVVFRAALWVHGRVMDLSNYYVASFWAVGAFCLMAIPAALSFRFIEAPFLRLRRPYLRELCGTRCDAGGVGVGR
jgi:peptidoglycan/LPS O-acetylase OafA/YrhL